MRDWKHIINGTVSVCALFLGCLMSACLMSFISKPKTAIAVFDMKRALNQTAALVSKTRMPEARQTELLNAFSKTLPDVLASYAASHRVTVIGSTVLADDGRADITDAVIEATLESLKHHE